MSGLAKAAATVRSAGRYGDRHLVHVNDRELGEMAELWGEPTINPETGLPEFFDMGGIGGMLGGIGSIIGAVAPLLGMIPGVGAPMASGVGGIASMMGGTQTPQYQGGVRNQTTGTYDTSPPTNTSASTGGLGAIFGPNFWKNAPAAALLTALDMMSKPDVPSAADQLASVQAAAHQGDKAWNTPLPTASYDRTQTNPNIDYTQYGQGPEQQFFNDNKLPTTHAKGGKIGALNLLGRAPTFNRGTNLTLAKGGFEKRPAGRMYHGPGGGQGDQIPAMLSDGEYVMDATTVSDLGDGDPDVGAQKLDQFRNAVGKQKGRKSGVPPRSHRSVLAYMGGAR